MQSYSELIVLTFPALTANLHYSSNRILRQSELHEVCIRIDHDPAKTAVSRFRFRTPIAGIAGSASPCGGSGYLRYFVK